MTQYLRTFFDRLLPEQHLQQVQQAPAAPLPLPALAGTLPLCTALPCPALPTAACLHASTLRHPLCRS